MTRTTDSVWNTSRRQGALSPWRPGFHLVFRDSFDTGQAATLPSGDPSIPRLGQFVNPVF